MLYVLISVHNSLYIEPILYKDLLKVIFVCICVYIYNIFILIRWLYDSGDKGCLETVSNI